MGPFFDMGFYDPRAAMGRDNNTLYVLLTGLSPGYLDAIDVSTDDPVVSVGIYTASYVHDLWVNWRGDKLYIDGAAYDLPALTPAGMIPVTATTATTIPSDSMIITGDWRYPIIYAWDADLLTEIDHIETVGGANLVRMSPHNRVLSAVIWGDNVELFWYTPGP